MARKMILEIVADTSKLDKGLRHATKETEGFGSALSGKLKVGFGELVKGTLVVEGVTKALEGMEKAIHAGIDEWSQQQKVAAQTQAVIKSTGAIAGVTAGHVEELGKQMLNLSGVDDEVVKAGENVLLSFTNIRNVAGHPIFDEATKSALDFSARTGKDMRQAALGLGRALQDPAKAAGALRRVQVVLTGAEKEGIATALKHGDVLKSQEIILGAVEKRYGGAAEAAGKTLPGQLNILRENFRNLAGEMVGGVVPAFSSVVSGLTGFVKKLGEAQGIHAKLNVVWEGVEDAMRGLWDALRRGFAWVVDQAQSVDWSALGQRISDKLKSIRWGHYIGVVAQKWSSILIAELNGLTKILGKVNWEQVGRMIVRGLIIAVAVTIKFLASVNWGGIVKAVWNNLLARFRALTGLLTGIGKEIGEQLWNAIQPGLEWVGRKLDELGTKIALRLIEPFSHLPSKLGDWARDLKDRLKGHLADIAKTANTGGEQVALAFSGGFVGATAKSADAITSATERAFGSVTDAAKAAQDKAAKAAEKAPAGGANAPTIADLASGAGAGGKGAKPMTPTERRAQASAWFDAAIQRQLDILSDRSLPAQIAGYKDVAKRIKERIAVTNDITRQLNLEDRLRGVVRQTRGVQAQIKANADQAKQARLQKEATTRQGELDRLQFAADIAAARSPAAAIAALTTLAARLKQMIGKGQEVAANERTLSETDQKIADIRTKRRQDARQAHLDALAFAVERADATRPLEDNIATREKEADAYRELIRKGIDVAASTKTLFGLEQEIAGLQAQRRQAARQAHLAALEFAVERAGVTKSLVDDLAARANEADAYKALIRKGVEVAANVKNLFGVEQEIAGLEEQQAQNRADRIKARQFRQLGLGPGGEALVPGARHLAAQLGSLEQLIQGTPLDTKQRRTLLDGVHAVLDDPTKWKQIGRDVRGHISQLLTEMQSALKTGVQGRPELRRLSVTSIISGLGLHLDPVQARRLGSIMTMATPSGTTPVHRTADFGRAAPITIHGGITMHGVRDWGDFENQLAKRQGARAHVRRGA